jgi:hypothetical protein
VPTACTVVARNYLPYARVLGASLREHQPDARLVTLVLDADRGGGEDEPFELVRPSDLDLPPESLAELLSLYDAKEAATALKPALMRTLLDGGAGAVLYLDPDILVAAPIGDLWQASEADGVTLIPHSLRPFPEDGRTPTDLPIRRAGTFNGGYVGVGPAGREFLTWWEGRLRRHAIFDRVEGLFVDQRWLDFVPSYFPYRILRDPTVDVAYWNLHDRTLTFDDGRFLVDGKPLRFFHFSSFDPRRPELLTRVADRFVAAGDPALEPLCRRYADLLLAAGYTEHIALPYEPEGGAPPGSRARRLRREALLEEDRLGTPGALTAAARLRAMLATPTEEVEAPSRWSAATSRARRLLLRLLKPVLDEQRLIDRALLDTVDERETRLLAEIAALRARVAMLEGRETS